MSGKGLFALSADDFWQYNAKHFACFHIVIQIRVEVWEDDKLKWEYEPAVFPRVFPRYLEFSQTSTSVSITYGNTEIVSISFVS